MNNPDDQSSAKPGPLLLLAEDNPTLREVTAEMLKSNNYRVIVSSDGKEAVELFKQYCNQISLAIFDVVMPRMSGPEAVEKILDIAPSLPVVFCTGYDRNLMLVKTPDNRQFPVVCKPFDFDDLIATIEKELHRNT